VALPAAASDTAWRGHVRPPFSISPAFGVCPRSPAASPSSRYLVRWTRRGLIGRLAIMAAGIRNFSHAATHPLQPACPRAVTTVYTLEPQSDLRRMFLSMPASVAARSRGSSSSRGLSHRLRTLVAAKERYLERAAATPTRLKRRVALAEPLEKSAAHWRPGPGGRIEMDSGKPYPFLVFPIKLLVAAGALLLAEKCRLEPVGRRSTNPRECMPLIVEEPNEAEEPHMPRYGWFHHVFLFVAGCAIATNRAITKA